VIAVLRSATVLAIKELHHHALALALIAFWSMLMVPIAMVVSFTNGGVSFASSGTALAYYYGPMAILLVVRRLVVQEYNDGTIRFLDALPAPAWLQFTVKTAVGWLASVAIVVGIALPVLGFASMREYVTVFWLVQLVVAIVLYTTAWLALVLAVAQTGRFRHWIWLVLLLLSTLEEDVAWQLWTWHASLGLTTDATRHVFPWQEFAVTTGWIAALMVAAAFLATFRGGSIPAIAFRSGSTRGRVNGTALVLGLYLVVEVLPEVGAGTLEGWDAIPEAAPNVRVVGDVGEWTQAAEESLAALDSLAPLSPPTQLVLAVDYSRRAAARSGPQVREWLWDRDEVHLRVRGTPTLADRARILDAVLIQRSAGMGPYDPMRAFAFDGMGLFAVEDPADRWLAEQRAALALRQGLTMEDLADWRVVRTKVGPDLAAGVGALGLSVLDPAALSTWTQDTLLPILPESAWTTRRLGRVHSIAGLDPQTHRTRWWARLQQAAETRAYDISETPMLKAVLTPPDNPVSQLDLAWVIIDDTRSLEGTWALKGSDLAGVELWVQPADLLRGYPTPYDPDYRDLVLPIHDSVGSTPTWFLPNDRLMASIRLWDSTTGAYLTSPQIEVGP